MVTLLDQPGLGYVRAADPPPDQALSAFLASEPIDMKPEESIPGLWLGSWNARGSVSRNVVPRPSSDSTSIAPLWRRIVDKIIASPRPEPLSCARLRREERLERLREVPSDMPQPVSDTEISMLAGRGHLGALPPRPARARAPTTCDPQLAAVGHRVARVEAQVEHVMQLVGGAERAEIGGTSTSTSISAPDRRTAAVAAPCRDRREHDGADRQRLGQPSRNSHRARAVAEIVASWISSMRARASVLRRQRLATSSRFPTITDSALLKSCAIPPASAAIASKRCGRVMRSASSSCCENTSTERSGCDRRSGSRSSCRRAGR